MTHSTPSRSFLPTRSRFPQGNFGWLYRNLQPWRPKSGEDELRGIAEAMTNPKSPAREHTCLPAAYTYFGQFITHDLTFDPMTVQQRRDDPDALNSYRTPAFDLDSVYGRGPDAQPYLYSRIDRFLLLTSYGVSSDERDLPRNPEGAALAGDTRNDESVLLSQLHLMFLLFHKRVLDYVRREERLTGYEAFERSRALVRWHYQWIVLHDYLGRILDPDEVCRVRRLIRPDRPRTGCDLLHFRPRNSPYLPIELSSAAFRFGHSLVRESYILNDALHKKLGKAIPFFDAEGGDDLAGGRLLPAGWVVHWRRRFLDGGRADFQRAMRFDTRLSSPLRRVRLPDGREESLAFLDLKRGVDHGLPSGQALARAMGLPRILGADEIGLESELGIKGETPLWYYALKESELQHDGLRLGRLASEIVAEVFVGLMRLDRFSYLATEPRWRPAFAVGGDFTLKDLMDVVDKGVSAEEA